MGIIPILIISFIFLVINSVLISILFVSGLRMREVSGWLSTTGTVLTSRLEEWESSPGEIIDYPIVTYSYQVNGQAYEGKRIAPSVESGGSGSAKVIARYPVGASVQVFYNPGDPSAAVLEKKLPTLWAWIALILVDGALCIATALLIYLR